MYSPTLSDLLQSSLLCECGALFLFQMIYIEIKSRGNKKLVDVIYLSLSELNNVEETKKQRKYAAKKFQCVSNPNKQ